MSPREISIDWPLLREQGPWLILALIAANTSAGMAGWVHWRLTGDASWVLSFFRYPNAVFTVMLTAAEVGCCYYALQQFRPGDVLRSAWMWLTAAAAAHFCGRFFTSFVPESDSWGRLFLVRETGKIIGGPVQMSLLLVALIIVTRHCHRLGLLRRFTYFDAALLGLVTFLAIRTGYGIVQYVNAGKPITWYIVTAWTSDPLLVALLLIAVLLRRSVSSFGFGFLANCWRSFIVAIVLTSLGDASLWCVQCSTYTIWNSLGWYVWFIADGAFALGPAFQVAAQERARASTDLFSGTVLFKEASRV